MKFSDVIGNKKAVDQIRRLVDERRMPHALLLHGEPGVPKLALALATAQYIHCAHRTANGDSCGVCPQCLQHQTMNHADTYFSFPYVKKADSTVCDTYIEEWKQFLGEGPVENYERWLSLIKSDNAQPQIFVAESNSIIRKMSMAPYSSEFKMLIMWLPEKMKEDCANKLLKIIEEPSPDSLFILVSDNAKGILPTIYSRTQRIELHKPSTDDIARYISARYGVDMQEALAVAAPADGNVILAEQNMQRGSESKLFHEEFVALMRMAYMRDLKSLKAWSEGIADMKREKSRRFLDYASRMVRENFIYNLHVPQLNHLTRDEQAFSSKFAPFINAANAEPLLKLFQDAADDIKANANGKIVLFDMAIRVTILIKR